MSGCAHTLSVGQSTLATQGLLVFGDRRQRWCYRGSRRGCALANPEQAEENGEQSCENGQHLVCATVKVVPGRIIAQPGPAACQLFGSQIVAASKHAGVSFFTTYNGEEGRNAERCVGSCVQRRLRSRCYPPALGL